MLLQQRSFWRGVMLMLWRYIQVEGILFSSYLLIAYKNMKTYVLFRIFPSKARLFYWSLLMIHRLCSAKIYLFYPFRHLSFFKELWDGLGDSVSCLKLVAVSKGTFKRCLTRPMTQQWFFISSHNSWYISFTHFEFYFCLTPG